MALMALTGRRPGEIFLSARFSLPKDKLPFPALIFSGQLKTRQAPGTSFEPYPIPVLAEPHPPSSCSAGRFEYTLRGSSNGNALPSPRCTGCAVGRTAGCKRCWRRAECFLVKTT